MINTKTELKTYLAADRARFSEIPNLQDWVLHNEKWYIYHYLRHLRYVEFYMNNRNGGGRFAHIPFLWHWFRYKRLGFKLRFTIRPNTCGPGLMIYHTGDFLHVGNFVSIGNNCTLLPGVVFSAKNCNDHVTVGDNCRFGLGVKIFGSVNIGDNVTIGANAVVTKDIPSNSVAVGIPAKVIKNI